MYYFYFIADSFCVLLKSIAKFVATRVARYCHTNCTHFSALMALEMRVKFIIAVRNRSIAVSIIPPLCKIRETSSALIQILSNVEPTVGEDADMLYVTLE